MAVGLFLCVLIVVGVPDICLCLRGRRFYYVFCCFVGLFLARSVKTQHNEALAPALGRAERQMGRSLSRGQRRAGAAARRQKFPLPHNAFQARDFCADLGNPAEVRGGLLVYFLGASVE